MEHAQLALEDLRIARFMTTVSTVRLAQTMQIIRMQMASLRASYRRSLAMRARSKGQRGVTEPPVRHGQTNHTLQGRSLSRLRRRARTGSMLRDRQSPVGATPCGNGFFSSLRNFSATLPGPRSV